MKIPNEELSVGRPLPFDVRDKNHTLLLRRGWIMGSDKERDILLSRDAQWHRPAPDLAPESREEILSLETADAFEVYGFLCARLERILREIGRTPGFDGYVFDLIKVIRDTLARQRDPMMSNLMLGRFPRYSIRHSVDTAILAEVVAAEAGMPAMMRNSLVAAALTMNVSMLEMQDRLHNFSKAIPDEVRALMQTHPQRSVRMLEAAGVHNTDWLQAVAQHHERLDGSGYPAGLRGSDISEEARYIAVADLMLARMQTTAYRAPEMPSKVFSGAYAQRGTELAEDAVSAAIKVLGFFPVGTLVRLRNGDLAVVTSPGPIFGKPVVKSITGELGMPLMAPLKRDTALEDYEILAVVDPERAGVAINRRQLWDFSRA